MITILTMIFSIGTIYGGLIWMFVLALRHQAKSEVKSHKSEVEKEISY